MAGVLALVILVPADRARAHVGHAHVTTLDDSVAADGRCSLREAIINANDNIATHADCGRGSGDDLISFDLDGVITLTSSLPPVSDPAGLLIDALGRRVTLDANGVGRPLSIELGAKATVRGLTLRGGQSSGGGGIQNAGTLSLVDVTVSASKAAEEGGGGIRNTGTLTASGLTLDGNTAVGPGGGLFNVGAATLGNVTLSGNRTEGRGGAIANTGVMTLTHGTLVGNTAKTGGWLWNGDGTFTMANSLVSDNRADAGAQCAGTVLVSGMPNLVEATDGCALVVVDEVAALGVLGFLLLGLAGVGIYAVAPGRGGALRALGVTVLVYVGVCGASYAWRTVAGTPMLGFAMGLGTQVLNGQAKVLALQDNGGRTQTHALAKGSPALDRGERAVCLAAPVGALDQRGQLRPEGGGCDLGAYEAIPVGGRDFALTVRNGRFDMAWLGGVDQDAYTLRRWNVEGSNRSAGAMPGTASTASEQPGENGELACFAAEPTAGGQAIGLSDVLCGVPRTGPGSFAAPQLTLQLRQSPIASVTWPSVAGAQRYVLASIPVRGGGTAFTSMAAGVVSNAAHNTAGRATCYTLIAFGEAGFGMSDLLCAAPGFATVGRAPIAGSASPAAIDQVADSLGPGIPSVRRELAAIQQRLEAGQPLQ